MSMFRRSLFLLLLVAAVVTCRAEITLERCVALSQENYPLIQKYGLLSRCRQIDLSDINKSWLPQIGIYAQGTVQNAVPSYPDALSDILAQMGTDMPGLDKLQYKVGVDLTQTVWDGGASKSGRRIADADNAQQSAALDVQLYAIRERVENLFFGILLLDEQIKQAELTQTVLDSNLEMMRAMKRNGTAKQSDADMVEAQRLTVGQQIIQARSLSNTYRRLLSIYTGTDITTEVLVKPMAQMPSDLTSNRPELKLYDAQMRTNDTRLGDIRSSLMPKIGLFAQAYYGYPGMDYFKSMMSRDLTFNVLAGVKVSWNIAPLYNRKNREQKLRLANDGIAADRDVFLFNAGLKAQSQTARIGELEDVMKEDGRIVELRSNIRRAAESQLANGVIDATALLYKITDENQARLTSAYHEIQLIQSIYQLKYTLNR